MSEPAEGTWKCIVLGGEANADDADIVTVRINAEVIEGPDSGRKVTYEDRVNNKSAKYIAQSAKAVGWRGGRLETSFRADVDAWIMATGGESTVEIRHVEIKKGKKYDKWCEEGRHGSPPVWGKANSIGRGPKPLRTPSQQASDDAHEAMMTALAESGDTSTGTPPADDVPPPVDDDIPFATCSRVGLGEIAKVLRW